MATDISEACQTHLKQNDKLWYYACLFAPNELREHYFALHAFATEVASVRARVSEPMPGEIRLQWWREVLEGQRAAEAEANPLSQALLATLAQTQLGAGPLIRLIDARRFDLYDDPMGPQSQYEGYAGETQSILFQYMGLMIEPDAGERLSTAAGHAGVVFSLIRHLYDFVPAAHRGQLFLPDEVLVASGVASDEVLKAPLEHAASILQKGCQVAQVHLDKAQQAVADLDKSLKTPFKILNVTKAQLKALERAAFDPQKLQPLGDLRTLWLLLTA